mmetsp:Transcript_23653/g.67331  ORF Transcript_23653/g.67331 Transcript_23653/m.67331 type:complete len:222 (-) Transcript_23653:2-667(-)
MIAVGPPAVGPQLGPAGPLEALASPRRRGPRALGAAGGAALGQQRRRTLAIAWACRQPARRRLGRHALPDRLPLVPLLLLPGLAAQLKLGLVNQVAEAAIGAAVAAPPGEAVKRARQALFRVPRAALRAARPLHGQRLVGPRAGRSLPVVDLLVYIVLEIVSTTFAFIRVPRGLSSHDRLFLRRHGHRRAWGGGRSTEAEPRGAGRARAGRGQALGNRRAA